MKNYAIVKDGVVTNIVIADEDWVALQTDTLVEYTEEEPAYIGGKYEAGTFFRPGADEAITDGEPGTEFAG